MFRRFNLAPKATEFLPQNVITPTHDREVTLKPENIGSPEQRARVISYFPDAETNRTWSSLTVARTVTVAPEKIRVDGINEKIRLAEKSLLRDTPEVTARVGRFIIEDPRSNPEDPITGRVFVMGPQMMRYEFVENDDGVTVMSAAAVASHREKYDLPVGARMTTSVRLLGPDNPFAGLDGIEGVDLDAVYVEEPAPEDHFVDSIVHAVSEYKQKQSV